jgi:hypothetical protein
MNISTVSELTYTDKAADLLNRRKVSQADREAFLSILEKTSDTSPQKAISELKSLSSQEREIIRVVHGLADSIQVDMLDEEGAYNLLRQPGEARDLNNDSFTRVGAAWTRSFPPANAPDEVKKAWEEVTAGKSDEEKFLLQTMFWPLEAAANVKYNAEGQAVSLYFPSDPEYTNIYAQKGFSYTGLIDRYLGYLNNVKAFMSLDDYEEKVAFAQEFKQALVKHGAD